MKKTSRIARTLCAPLTLSFVGRLAVLAAVVLSPAVAFAVSQTYTMQTGDLSAFQVNNGSGGDPAKTGEFNSGSTALGFFAHDQGSGVGTVQAVGFETFNTTGNGSLGFTARSLQVGDEFAITIQDNTAPFGKGGIFFNQGTSNGSAANYNSNNAVGVFLNSAGTWVYTTDGGTTTTSTGVTSPGTITLTLDITSTKSFNLSVNGTLIASDVSMSSAGLIQSMAMINQNDKNNGAATDLIFSSASLTNLGGATGGVTVGGGSLNTTATIAGAIQDGLAANSTSTGSVNNVTKNGTGTVTLTGPNTYTGTTAISTGILNIQNNTGLGSTTAGTTVSSGATLQLQGGITVGAESLTIAGTGASGATGALENVSGTNTFGGAINTTAASTISADASSTLLLTGGTGTGSNTLTFSGGGTIKESGTIANQRDLNVSMTNGSGSLTLSVANTYGSSKNTNLNSGTLIVGNDSALGSSTIAFSGGTLQSESTASHNLSNAWNISVSGTIAGTQALTLSGSGSTASNTPILTVNNTALTTLSNIALTISTTARTLTLAGTGNTSIGAISEFAGGAGSLTITNTGTTTLAGANNYSGTTLMNASAGTLVASGANSAAGGTTLTAGTLQLNNGTNGGIGTGALSLNGGTLQAVNAGRSLSNVTTLDANSTISGSQNLAFTNNFTVTGAATRTLTDSLSGSSTLSLSNVYLSDLTGTGRTLIVTGSGNILFGGPIANFNGGGGTAGSLQFNNTFTGTATLNGTDTYSGGTTLSSGTFVLGNKAAFGSGTVAWNGVSTSASTDLSGTNAIGNINTSSGGNTFTGSNNVQFSNTWTDSSTQTLTNNLSSGTLIFSGGLGLSSGSSNFTLTLNGSGNTTFNSAISNGSGGSTASNLIYGGTGTLTLNAVNTYGGSTTLNGLGGTTKLGIANALPIGTSLIFGGGPTTPATLDLNGNSQQVSSLSDGGTASGAITNSGAGSTFTLNDTNTGGNNSDFFFGPISGAITFNKTGTGTADIGGANTYTGGTFIKNGTIVVNSSAAASTATSGPLGASTQAVTLGDSATSNSASLLLGRSATAGGYTLANNITVQDGNSGTMTLGGQNTSGTNTFSGNVTLGATLNTAKDVTLIAAAGGEVDFTGNILKNGSSNGNVTVGTSGNTGTIKMTGANTYSGATTVNFGKLTVTGSMGSTAATVANGATFAALPVSNSLSIASLTLNQGSSFTMSGDNAIDTLNLSSGLTIGGASGSVANMTFDLGTSVGSVDKIVDSSAASIGPSKGQVTINPLGNIVSGSYTLISATSGLGSNFTLSSNSITQNGKTYNLSLGNSTATSEILTIAVASPSTAYWSGGQSSIWNTVNAGDATNWRTDATSNIDTQQVPGASTNVHFSTTAPVAQNLTNTLGQDFSINSLTFDSGAASATIGGSNNLTTAAGITNNSANTQTINVQTVTLGAAQTYNAASGDLTFGGTTLTLGANRLTVLGSHNTSIGNVVTSSSSLGNILKQGSGTLTLAGDNTFTGGLFIDQGKVSLTAVPALGSLAYAGAVQLGNTVSNNNSAELNLGSTGGGQTLSSAITITTSAQDSGAKTLSSSAASNSNTFSGPITVGDNFAATSAGGGNLIFSGAVAATSAETMTLGGLGTVTLQGSGDNSFLQATVNSGVLVLNKTSDSSHHALGGSTETVSGGILQLSGSGGDQIANGGSVIVSSGAFDLNGASETISSLTLAGTGIGGNGSLTNGNSPASTLTLNNSSSLSANSSVGGAGDITITGNGKLTGQTGGTTLTKVGNDTLTLSNASGVDNQDLLLQVNAGTVLLAKTSTAVGGAHDVGSVTVNGGTVQLGGSGNGEIYEGKASSVASGGVLDLNGQSQTFSGAGNLTINGTGISSGGALINSNTGASSILTGPVNLGSNSSAGGAGNFAITGVVSGSGTGLTKVGNGTLTLNGSAPNTYNGATILSAGELDLSKTGGATAVASNTINVSGGTMLWLAGSTNEITTAARITMTGGILNLNGATQTVMDLTNGGLSGGGLFETNGGSWSGTSNSMTWGNGSTNLINGGSVTDIHISVLAGSTNTISGGSFLNVMPSGTGLEMTGSTITNNGTINLSSNVGIHGTSATSNLSGSGIINIAGQTPTFTVDSGDTLNVANSIQGASGSLTKAGAGTMLLTGNNTYTGTTTVNATGGTLNAGATGALGGTADVVGVNARAAIIVNSGGTLAISGSGNLDRINNAATISLNAGTFLRSGGGTVSEGIGAVNNGGTISGTNTTGLGALTLAANSTLDFGTGGVGTLVFADFVPVGHILNILNWTSSASFPATQSGTDGTDDRLIFATDQSTNLADFNFGGISAQEIALGGGFFEITPVPETSTWAMGALTLSALLVSQRRRLSRPALQKILGK